MSIIRFSCDRTTLFAPTPAGEFVDGPYDATKQVGRLGALDDVAALDKAIDAYLAALWPANGAALVPTAPVAILVHGFLFDPRDKPVPPPFDTSNPHGCIYHFLKRPILEESRNHDTGWPVRLGFNDGDGGAAGVAIGFGWFSSPHPGFSFSFWHHNFYAEACRIADASAAVLARLVLALQRRLGGHKVDIVAHSMGTWLTVAMLRGMLASNAAAVANLGRIILMGASAYAKDARDVAQQIESRGAPDVYNFASRADDVLEDLARYYGPSMARPEPVVGYDGLGASAKLAHWISIDLNDPKLQTWGVNTLGHALLADFHDGKLLDEWADHWTYFVLDGNTATMADILRKRAATTIAAWRAAAIPETI
jgi:pimeloyl-ACP methyl ester carboxylesterase